MIAGFVLVLGLAGSYIFHYSTTFQPGSHPQNPQHTYPMSPHRGQELHQGPIRFMAILQTIKIRFTRFGTLFAEWGVVLLLPL